MTAKEGKQTVATECPGVTSVAVSFMGSFESGQTTEQEMETRQSCRSGYRAQTSRVQEMCSDLETTQGEQPAEIFQPHSALSMRVS